MYGRDSVAPPGNQVATEKTNIDLQHRESPVYSTKNSTPADEIQGNAAARFPETDLKQVLWKRGSGRERPKSLILLLGHTGVESVAR